MGLGVIKDIDITQCTRTIVPIDLIIHAAIFKQRDK